MTHKDNIDLLYSCTSDVTCAIPMRIDPQCAHGGVAGAPLLTLTRGLRLRVGLCPVPQEVRIKVALLFPVIIKCHMP